jgi:hypothetical protein
MREKIDLSKVLIDFRCCFCHEPGATCALVFVVEWTGPEEGQSSQQFFCHPECFERITGETVEILRSRPEAPATN